MGLFSGVGKAVKKIGGGALAGGLGFALGGPAGAAGALSFLGGAQVNQANSAIAQRQMDFQAKWAKNQMDFQEKMSNSAYERAMADMRRSGLNPILAYKQGGASTPSGASVSGAGIPAVDELAGIMPSAFATKQSEALLRQAAVQRKKTVAETAGVKAAETNTKTDTLLKKAMTIKNANEALKAKHDAEAAFYGISSAKSAARLKSTEATRTEAYGSSATGQNLFSLEQMLRRAIRAIWK